MAAKKPKSPPKNEIHWRIKPAQKRTGSLPILRNGEPRAIELGLWEGDHAFHGEEITSCCGCGLDHFHTYELFVENRHVILQVRAYRLHHHGKLYDDRGKR